MSKLFQIEENDLGELERILPDLAEAMMPILDNRLRIKLRRCQSIVSNVRWRYGPAQQYGVVPTGEEDND